MKSAMNIILVLLSGLLLAACGSIDSASYMIGGAPHSLSLTRTKNFFWSNEWELALVTARNPECMRRHKLQPVTGADFKVELYRALEGNYIVKQGNNWYVTETQQCRLQQFKAPPREPGDLLGVFEEKEDGIKFVAAPAGKLPAPTVAPATPPAQVQDAAAPPQSVAPAPVTR
jgi:hypothetical protein